MHKIDKHTGLYLEWGGPTLTPVNEMRWTLLEEDATLNDLASQINDFLLTKSLGFRNKVHRGILATLPDYCENTRLWDLVIGYPTTALSVVEDLDYKRELEFGVRMEATKNEVSDGGGTQAALDLFDSIHSREQMQDIFLRAGLTYCYGDRLMNREQVKMYPHSFVKSYRNTIH